MGETTLTHVQRIAELEADVAELRSSVEHMHQVARHQAVHIDTLMAELVPLRAAHAGSVSGG